MAATHVDVVGGEDESKQMQPLLVSPRNLTRTWSSNSSSGGSPAVCICAPTTHPGSFKCRLHRVTSDGHSSSAPLPQQQHQPPVSNSSTRTTVEAV